MNVRKAGSGPSATATPRFPAMFEPDFELFLKTLRREPTPRPVLFEHYIDWSYIWSALGSRRVPNDDPPWGWIHNAVNAYASMGYDTLHVPLWRAGVFSFPKAEHDRALSIGQFGGGVIASVEDVEKYPWPDPESGHGGPLLDGLSTVIPRGMKILLGAPEGIYDNLVGLMGFENLCLLAQEEPDLVEKVCHEIAWRSRRYLERLIHHPTVGGIIVTDDWGFKTSTFLSPDQLRRFIFPGHRAFARLAHEAGKVAVLHSCGQVGEVMDDIIDDLGYDGKHSYEDLITPVEEAYRLWGSRIAILGGLDVHFLMTSTPGEVYRRARALLDQTMPRGGYALGTGNSVADGVPNANFQALLRAAVEWRA